MKYVSILIPAILSMMLLGGFSSLSAQSPEVAKLLAKGDANPDSSKLYHYWAKDLAKERSDDLGYAEANYRLALYYERVGVPELSPENLEVALSIYLKQGPSIRRLEILQKYQEIAILNRNPEKAIELSSLIAKEEHLLANRQRVQNTQYFAGILLLISLLAMAYFGQQSIKSRKKL